MRDEAASASAPGGGTTVEHPASSEHEQSSSTSNADSASSKAPSPRGWLSSVRRPRTSPAPKASALKSTLLTEDDARRDSALASLTSTASTDPTHNAPSTPTSLRKTPSLPAIVVQDAPPARPSTSPSQQAQASDEQQVDLHDSFQLDTIIPTGDFDDLTSPNQVSFSKRGSMLVGGKRANKMNKQLGLVAEGTTAPETPRRPVEQEREQEQPQSQEQRKELSAPVTPHLSPRSPSRFSTRGRVVSNRVLSADEMMLSRKVRSMYNNGNESAADWERVDEGSESVQNSLVDSSVADTPANGSTLTVDRSREDNSSIMSSRRGSAVIAKEPNEVAGGIEDWSELEGGEIDRYGFILPKKTGTSNGDGIDGPDEPRIQRVSTALKLVSEEPRRRALGRSVSKARSARSANPRSGSPKGHRSQKSKPAASIFSNRTARSTPQKPLRQAANRLPHNRDRRLLDEASDMLKLPPGLAEVAEQQEGGRVAQAMKAKEIEREEKWRKMAKVVQSGANSGGMMFEFDVKDPKVISRTWKGIPDRWRATAWYAFLAASAKADPESPADEELVASFYELQEESSADDMQIDVDVPRTINRHIMFRRRYRGGQRLLFRVLHAMSLYLPDTGYVQGMAALAATLLCYYEEDRAFVMLVRLWMLRGLERLYESGFAGLMEALADFETNWLRNGDVAKKLEELGITSTAYGTRWYLTLFNYSLPFPAQLRVWDVFMLLGDASLSNSPTSTFSGDLDVLHATSAALIDATREILLDSDFENAMKVLTSWVPIKDEDLLMRVAKTEYKMRKKRANVG
ncbi:RabGAP/TBC [Lentithecium fluviatile CBS 122367]|uniref:RabGAP/TBC n=1 Tax=Lentithecium fluviatile CBS 122367 TaxID=1168545 RepID=A0A6G1IFA4_9PLEO|nr:RabGAP/TBC [Lentithecium fluviatile CBS 122367]